MRWGCEEIRDVPHVGKQVKVVKFRYKEELESWIAEKPAVRRQLMPENPEDRKLRQNAQNHGASIGSPIRMII